MKDPHTIVIRPYITEKTAALSYGDARIHDEKALVRRYTFLVAPESNKIEIKQAVEAIYNAGKKKGDAIKVMNVRTVTLPGKTRRVRSKARAYPTIGKTSKRKKAIVTLAKGQMLEDYGV